MTCARALPLDGWINTRPHFWAWEGMASWFETLENRDGKLLPGRRSHVRLKLARQEAEQGKWIPLTEFVLRDQMKLGRAYQQACALVDFFMTGEGGRHREKFLEFYRVVAAGNAAKDSFRKAMGADIDEFQKAILEHVKGYEAIR
jgi:hypothetical protein